MAGGEEGARGVAFKRMGEIWSAGGEGTLGRETGVQEGERMRKA